MLGDHEGPLTIVVTDVVGSTSLTTARGDDAARRALRRHDDLVRRLVAEHRGHVVKGLGDGFLLAFTSVRRALDLAVELQRSLEATDGLDLQVRIGVNVGEVIVEDADLHGQAVNAAARIAAVGGGGEILVSDVTRQLVGAGPDLTFEPAGDHELKGFDAPWSLHRLCWRRPSSRPVLPATVLQGRPAAFVGREDVLEALDQRLTTAAPRQLVLLAGEPGIGKTGLVTEFAARAHERGATVLFGRCDEDTVVPYQPFTEALRQALDAEDVWREDLPARVGSLRAVLPELGDRLPPGPPPDHDPEASRYQLFEAVAWVLHRSARAAPVLLVLDDLHWADRPTLLLLQHVLRTAGQADLLFVGTYRDTDLDRRHPLAAVLAELRRRDGYERLPVRGLPKDAILHWLERTAGQDLGAGGARLAEALWDETEGNPFFVSEIVRHLIETGGIYQADDGRWTSAPVRDLGLPEGVREVVGRRLSRLSEACNNVLAAASVLGRAAHVEVLSRITERSHAPLLVLLEEAVDANLVTPDEAGDVYAFTHALVRETLYEELSLPRRQRLHLAAADALSATPRARASAATVAAHYRLAGVAAEPEQVVAATVAAGEEAFAVAAYEEAAEHWRGALDLLDEHGAPPEERARVLERYGDVTFVSGLDRDAGVAALEEAVGLHARAGREVDQARLHSKLGRTFVRSVFDMDTSRAGEHFRIALSLASGHPHLRAYALVGLTGTALWRGETPTGEQAAEEALALAQEIGDQVLYANAAGFLGFHRALLGRIDGGLELLEESWTLGQELDTPFVRFQAAWMAQAASFNANSARDARAWADRMTPEPWLASAPLQDAIARGQQAWTRVIEGDLPAMREAAEDPLIAGQGLGGMSHLSRGDTEAAVEAWSAFLTRAAERGNFWDYAPPHLWMVQTHTRLGDPRDALPHLDALLNPPMGALSPVLEVYVRAELADTRAALGDTEEAAREVERIQGLLSGFVGSRGLPGAVASAAGSLAAARGDRAAVDHEFQRAVDVLDEYGNRWFGARSMHQWARALIRLGDPDAAAARLDATRDRYEQMGCGAPWIEAVERDRQLALTAG